jgi:PhnB protein
MGARSPQTLGGSPAHFLIYVPEVDRRIAQAVAAGARIIRPIQDQFYGDRSGTIEDPFGHQWTIATHIEDIPPDEMARRAQAAMQAPPKK